MKDSDLKISGDNGSYRAVVCGRANFEYAVPLRDLAKSLDDHFSSIQIDLALCTAMDSTFMGVLSMIGLKAIRCKAKVEICNASEHLQRLLRDLGVARLFSFSKTGDAAVTTETTAGECAGTDSVLPKRDLLTTAETVSEAHKTLVEADDANHAKFDQVIQFADQDVERLKKEKK